MSIERTDHWERVFATRADTDVSWYQAVPEASLALVAACGLAPDDAVIDVGAGSSALAGHLLARGHTDVTALDLSATALARAHARLGADGERIAWIVGDVTRFEPPRRYRLWHDRALLHFLVAPADQRAYARAAQRALAPGGWIVLATFAPHGPTRCSGLEVQRHDAASMALVLGGGFETVEERLVDHVTPSGAVQAFTYARFRRR